MKSHPIFKLSIVISTTNIQQMDLNEEQSNFYLGRLPSHCSRNNFFNVLELVKKNRPQNEIDFFERIALQTKNESYQINIEGIPAISLNESSESNLNIYKPVSIKPEADRPLVVICYDNTIYSPVRFCGKHFHILDNSGIRTKTIYKWAYQDELFNQLAIEPIDPELAKKIEDELEAERAAHKKRGPHTILDILAEALKDFAKDLENDQPKRPYH